MKGMSQPRYCVSLEHNVGLFEEALGISRKYEDMNLAPASLQPPSRGFRAPDVLTRSGTGYLCEYR